MTPRPADPGVLPGDGNTLVVSSESDVSAVVITDLYRLLGTQGERSCDPDAGAGLARRGIRYAAQAGNPSEPVISIQRTP